MLVGKMDCKDLLLQLKPEASSTSNVHLKGLFEYRLLA